MGKLGTGDVLATAVALALGAPLVYMLGAALADGERRANDGPIRAILGGSAYEAILGGDDAVHYVGDDRLAPDFTLRDQQGRTWKLSDHRGKVVIMNFWTITCQPCVEEMPSLVALATNMADRDDVEVVTISTDAGWDDVSSLFPRGSRLRVLFDSDRAVTRDKFGTRLFPETWFIDPDGVVRLRVDGPRDWSAPLVLDLIESFQS